MAEPVSPRRALAGDAARMAVLTLVTITLAYLVTVAGVELAGFDSRVVYPCGLVLASTLNFFGCRYFVFRNSRDGFWRQAGLFAASIGLFRLVEMALFGLAITAGLNYHVAFVAVAAFSVVAKFLVARGIVFR